MPMITRSEQAGWQVFFEASFSPKPDGRRPGRELPLNRTFLWDGASCRIPSVYLCEEGLVLDVLLQADTDAVKAWIERWGLTPETETGDLSPEQEMRIQNENPLHRDFSPAVCLNGQRFKFAEGCSFVWLSLFPEHADSDWAAVRDHYRLDPACCWAVHRFTFRSPVQRMESLSVTLTPEKIELPGPHFTAAAPGDTIRFTGPAGTAHTLTVQCCEKQTLAQSQNDGWIYPQHFVALDYTVTPPLSREEFKVVDSSHGDQARKGSYVGAGPSGVIGIIGAAHAVALLTPQDVEVMTAASSLYFDPPEQIEWRIVFRVHQHSEITLPLL